MDQAAKKQEILNQDKEIKSIAHSFICGQGSIYVLEKQNKVEQTDTLVLNGPVYMERSWNARSLNATSVQELAEINGGLIFPKAQEFAIIIAVSHNLLDDVDLAAYESHDFPNIAFNNHAEGGIYIINGHHRIEALILKNKVLLDSYNHYRKILGNDFKIPSDHDSPEILEARENIKTLQHSLYDNGGWGAIVLDYGMVNAILIKPINNANLDKIMQSPRVADIKAYWARNNAHFNVPDSPSDLLQLILKTVTSMSENDGYDFLQLQLNRTNSSCRTKIKSILKNPQLLHLFSNLTKFPMFETVKLLNFSQIYLWRKIVPCWLDVFLNFAQDSFKYLGSPCGADITSITDIKHNMDLPFAYKLFDIKFHNIIDSAYKTHLVPSFIAFGAPDGTIEVNGQIVADWNESFADYRTEILENLKVWADDDSQLKQYHAILKVFSERVEYILDHAQETYPFISNLKTSIPLASNTFIQDIASDLYSVQDGMLEVCFHYSFIQ